MVLGFVSGPLQLHVAIRSNSEQVLRKPAPGDQAFSEHSASNTDYRGHSGLRLGRLALLRDQAAELPEQDGGLVAELGLARPHPIVVLNIGGVANITYVADAHPIACDTGPGNALIDDFMRARTGTSYDKNGDAAASGRVEQVFIDRVLAHPFFDRKPPKSLDRNDFALANIKLPELSVPDGAATLSALTAQSIARIVPHLPSPPRAWIVSGGGARNRTMMRMLGERLAPATVESADDVGWSAEALEAQAFAFLAVRCLYSKPLTFPTTTGAPHPMPGGVVARLETR